MPEGCRASPSKKRQGIIPEAGLTAAGVRQAAFELGPKSPPVAPDAGVDKLMQDDILGEVRRQDGEHRVKLDASGG